MTRICGIYKITNTINNKIYIGKSNNIERRWQEHKEAMQYYFETRIMPTKQLYKSARKRGLDCWKYEIIELIDINDPILLNEKEIYYIKLYKSMNHDIGYNEVSGGEGGDGHNWHKNRTFESYSNATKKANETMGKERRSLRAKKGQETMGKERRSNTAKKRNENIGKERRHLRGIKANKTFKEANNGRGIGINFNKNITHDQLSLRAKKAIETFKKNHNGKGRGICFHNNRTHESYINACNKRTKNTTHEQRSLWVKTGLETRRKNKLAKLAALNKEQTG
ncbi:MAG: GIY-YIG nuclease family protein [Mycoplasmataceae bacterium]|nr:GIY-YIG nuclease family protein [Mycoplasmataceae bacterium]